MIRVIFAEGDAPGVLISRKVEYSDKNGPQARQGECLRIKLKGTEYTCRAMTVVHVCSAQKRKHTELYVKLEEGQ